MCGCRLEKVLRHGPGRHGIRPRERSTWPEALLYGEIAEAKHQRHSESQFAQFVGGTEREYRQGRFEAFPKIALVCFVNERRLL